MIYSQFERLENEMIEVVEKIIENYDINRDDIIDIIKDRIE